ncbi:hypothetical protein TRFO_17722 [Tritrichomonas foetus]|uniref:Protein kinase domain-containing protein n=1 Tax=Tritrichomonas foetus TaxID=1144522 RepID=A0A1J4KS04_9EUKA|nr:hypothetical protein TRFO_17722 [Tritrichomonas foetus]|eukprot:OHT12446.1 hypothetical protein TRFO_17722 [Tritrichomonas foetus]
MEENWYIRQSLDDLFESNVSIKGNIIKKGHVKATKHEIAFKHSTAQNYERLVKESYNYSHYVHPALQSIIGFYRPENLPEANSILITPFYQHYSLDRILRNEEENYHQNLIINILQVCGICSALEFLSKNNICHGDLNPSNILIDQNGHPYLKGYNLYTRYSPDDQNTNDEDSNDNRINYYAPEIFEGSNFTNKSDVYSFGLIVNEIFSHEVPYSSDGNNRSEIISKIRNHHLPQISASLPSFLRTIVNKCLQQNPSDRPKFKKIMGKLRSNLDEIPGDTSFLYMYLSFIKGNLDMPSKFFRAPVTVVEQVDDSYLNTHPCQSPIKIRELERIFGSIEVDRPINLISVFGFYQVGKSTFLRALTGNSAYLAGDGVKSTTMGIMIDGPYTADYLIDRIKNNDELKQYCNSINLDDNPAIFFIDSQGIGDEEYEGRCSQIMELIHAIFCSVSDICINITLMREPEQSLAKIIKTMRRCQLIKPPTDFTKVLFLVRDFPERFVNQISSGTRTQFLAVEDEFLPLWNEQHNIAENDYYSGSFKAIPLSNLRNTVGYNFCVQNILVDILSICKDNHHNSVEILRRLNLVSSGLFLSGWYQDYETFLNTYQDIIPTELTNDIEKNIWIFGKIAQFKVHIAINKGKEDPIRELEILASQLGHLTNIFAPFILGGYSTNSKDFIQFAQELRKCNTQYIMNNSDDWNAITSIKEPSKLKQICDGVCSGITFLAQFTSVLPPPISGTVCMIGGAYSLYNLISEYKESKMIQEIKNRPMPSVIPYIWNRDIKKGSIKMLPIDNSNRTDKIIKTINSYIGGVPNKYNLILAFQENNCDLSKIIQAMTGIECDFSSMDKVIALIGPVSPNTMVNRTTSIGKGRDSNIKSDIAFLYIKGIQRDDELIRYVYELGRIKQISTISAFKFNERNRFFHPLFSHRRDFFFVLVDDIPICPIKSVGMTQYLPQFRSILDLNYPNSVEFFPIVGSSFDFSHAGPRTNATLNFAFRVILSDKAITISMHTDNG